MIPIGPKNSFDIQTGAALSPRAGLENVNAKDPASIQRVAREFEAMFLGILMRSMRATVTKGGLLGPGKGEEMFQSLWDNEISRLGAGSEAGGEGLGLARLLIESLGGAKEEATTTGYVPRSAREKAAKRYTLLGDHRHHHEDGDEDGGGALFRSPVEGVVSSRFGLRRDPITGETRFHHGLDVAAPEGSPIYPAAQGKVIFSGEKAGYGNVVIVQHDGGYVTKYGHNARNLAKLGDIVDPATPIGLVGSSGRSTGPHLHFEIARNGQIVDPERVMEKG